jgi:hypothetical protein
VDHPSSDQTKEQESREISQENLSNSASEVAEITSNEEMDDNDADIEEDYLSQQAMANAERPHGYNPKEWWMWVGNPSSDSTEEPESCESCRDEMSSESVDGDDADDEEVEEKDEKEEKEAELNPENEMFKIDYGDSGWARDFKKWQAEYARKWKHFERQELRRLKRGIGPAQLFRHPGIESKMWTPNSPSSEDLESDEIDSDEPPYWLE